MRRFSHPHLLYPSRSHYILRVLVHDMATQYRRNSRVHPEESNRMCFFNRSNTEPSDDIINKTRSLTDGFWLFFFAIFQIGLLCFLGYCVFNGDIFRTINGYDDCGYVCGKSNDFLGAQRRNSGHCLDYDKTKERYHIVIKNDVTEDTDRLCVSDCSKYEGYLQFLNMCIQNRTGKVVNKLFSKSGLKNFFSEVSEDFHVCWREMCYLCLISLGLSLIMLVLFRFLVGVLVWVVLLGSMAAGVTSTIVLWIMWSDSRRKQELELADGPSDVESRRIDTVFAFAILASVATAAIALLIWATRKRIRLVVQLFREAGKAVGAMPLLLLQPILTFLCLATLFFLCGYVSLWVESAGTLAAREGHRRLSYRYEKDAWMGVARWYNLFAVLWTAQFVVGCQHVVVAGAVATWYFDRKKRAVVSESAGRLVRYHLGSVAVGSFLVAVATLARVALKAVEGYLGKRQGRWAGCALDGCRCCLFCFEKVLKYLSRNAYIEVAIMGFPFCKAGRQAIRLLSSNVLRVAAINSVGDFVLFLGKALVVVASVLIAVRLLQFKDGIQHMWVPVTLSGLVAYFVAHCFIATYEMTIDTIFLCFCEDCEQNDGVQKPYYMSRGLMEFVENSDRKLGEAEIRSHQVRQSAIMTVSGKVM